MPYNLVAESFHIEKLCSRVSSRKLNFVYGKVYFAILSAPSGSLGATHAVRSKLIGKPIVDFY